MAVGCGEAEMEEDEAGGLAEEGDEVVGEEPPFLSFLSFLSFFSSFPFFERLNMSEAWDVAMDQLWLGLTNLLLLVSRPCQGNHGEMKRKTSGNRP
jgi:hypothetical protein